MKTIKQCIYLLVVSFCINDGYAQQIKELGSVLSSLSSAPDVFFRSNSESLKELAYEAVPTIYYQNGQLTRIGGDEPVRLITDVHSLTFLKSSNALYNHVELISIKIQDEEELKLILKTSELSGFVKLRYVWFQMCFNVCEDLYGDDSCVIKKVAEMILHDTGAEVNILYTTNIDN